MKRVRFTWDDFLAKMDHEGTDYMMTQIDPKGVPKELESAHAALVAAREAWDDIIEEHAT